MIKYYMNPNNQVEINRIVEGYHTEYYAFEYPEYGWVTSPIFNDEQSLLENGYVEVTEEEAFMELI